VALVTGGSIGIGRMIAEGLAVNGCKVYITSRKEEACLATAAELNEIAAGSGGECIGFGSDLSAVEGCEMAAEYVSQREEKLHILINNAGATVRALGVDASCFVSAHIALWRAVAQWGGRFDEYPDSAWQRVMDLNVRGVFNLTQKCAKLLEAAGMKAIRPCQPS
jgi:NAD(P)-dependent dehydrogenase (short-subunit alcohol dehydrogenase family)